MTRSLVFSCLALLVLTSCGLDSGGGASLGPINQCRDTSDCVVVPQSCCGSCGQAAVGDATAVALDHLSEQRALACEGSSGCPACFGDADLQLVATCEMQRCELVDLRTRDEITSCNAPSDCVLRFAGCCTCSGGSETDVVAIRGDAEAAYQSLTCDSDQACPECAPLIPSFLLPGCNSGRCTVEILTDVNF